jgi:CHAT domain-containing protein/tetratricopeptide (TPR) repeat protein
MLGKLALIYLSFKEYTKAKLSYQKLFSVINMDTMLSMNDLAMALIGYGCLLTETGNFREGISYLQRAIRVIESQGRLDKSIPTEILPDRYAIYNSMICHYLLSKAYMSYVPGNDTLVSLKKSLVAIERAVKLQNRLLMQISVRDEERLINLQEDNDLHSLALEIAWRLRRFVTQDEFNRMIFRFMEESRSVSLKRMMVDEMLLHSGSVPDSLTDQLKHWRNSLAHYERLIYDGRRGSEHDEIIAHWEQMVRECRGRVEALTAAIQVAHPQCSELLEGMGGVSLEDVQRKLPRSGVVLSFSIAGDSVLYLMRIGSEGSFVHRIVLPVAFTGRVMAFRKLLSAPDLTAQSRDDLLMFQHLANELYEWLIVPAGSLQHVTELMIIPDGMISYIPFEVLVRKPHSSPASYRSLDYLLNHYAISYHYSLSLKGVNDFKPMKRLKVVAFAPSYVNREDDPGALSHPPMEPLPGALDEIRRIREFAGGRIYSGIGATKEAFMQEAPSGVVLHMAMHAQVVSENHLFSNFVFYDGGNGLNDARLNGYEIFQMEIRSPMVVMSACNSGFGKVRAREGLMNLGRGFLKAGVPVVVMSHWDVDDRSGSLIMPGFYRFLAEGNATSEALQKAKIGFLSDADGLRAHPYFWAAPVVFGDPKELVAKSGHTFPILPAVLIVALLLLTLFLLIYFHKKSMKIMDLLIGKQ